VRPDGSGGFTQECDAAVWDFPKATSVNAGNRVRIRIRKKHRPEKIQLRAWPRVNQYDEPQGRAQTVSHRVRVHFDPDGSVVAYDVIFRLPEKEGHYYLMVRGYWADQDGSGRTQDAAWTFHASLH
jgi:hypothetical protein